MRPPFGSLAGERRDGLSYLALIAHAGRGQRHAEGHRSGFGSSQVAGPGEVRRVLDHQEPGHAGRDLPQHLQPFPDDRVLEVGQARDVAARPAEARHQAATNRIAHLDEDDRHRSGRLLKRLRHRRAAAEDDVRRQSRQLRRESPDAVCVSGRKAVVYPDIAAVPPAERLEPFSESGEPRLRFWISLGILDQDADPPQPVGRLGKHGMARQEEAAAQGREDLPPLHSITSSDRFQANPSLVSINSETPPVL
jgi:hypothetical protein